MSRFLAALVVLVIALPAQALPVRVRGGARLQAQARFVDEDATVLELRGRLTDDGLAPVEETWIELTEKGGLELRAAGGCNEPRVSIAPMPGGVRVRTAAGGELCLRWRDTPARGALRLFFPGDRYHGSADLEVGFDRTGPQKLATTLRFEPRPSSVDLDKEVVSLTLVLDLALATAHASREGLAVTLQDETDKILASGRTGGDGKVHLSVKSAALGDPGVGKLRARFEGNAQLEPAHDEQTVTRHTAVALSLSEALDGASPGDSAQIALTLSAKRGTVDSGVVEALIGGSSAGSTSVSDGRALLLVPIDAKQAEPLLLSIRYLPASPFFREGAPLAVELPVAPPSPWFRGLLMLVVLAAAAWVAVSWRRAKKPPTLGKGAPMLTPGVHVIERAQDGRAWKGTVVDAHEGTLLAGVRIVIRAPSLEGDGIVLSVDSDERGRFAFELPTRPDGAELCASAARHSEERRPLPPAGTLRVALVTRRRAVLRRLVSWARVRGAPYDQAPEPTPAHVRAAADRDEVRTWASGVEHAAFGPDEVEAHVETELRDREPGPT